MGPKTILHVIDSLHVSGGAEQQLVTNLSQFGDRHLRHEVAVLKHVDHSRASQLSQEIPVHHLYEPGERVTKLGTILRLRRLVSQRDPHLLHASLAESALASRVVGALSRLPTVESLVNISHESVRKVDNPRVTQSKLFAHIVLDRLTMQPVTAFHALSQAVADSWADTVGINPHKIEVIPRAVELPAQHSSPEERRLRIGRVLRTLGLPADTKLILAVGRVEPQKGHRYLIEAIRLLKDRHPNLRLVIVGRPGLASPKVERSIETGELSNLVTLTGARTDVRELLSATDLFVYPSLFEGYGVALLEAMAAGAAIITTNRAPMNELIRHEQQGLLVEAADSSGLADAIDLMFKNDRLRARLGAAAAEKAGELPTPAENAKKFEALYGRLLGL